MTFDDEHVNQKRGHKVTEEEAKGFIKNTCFSMTVWNGKFENYYSEFGAAFVLKENNLIRTAFSSKEYESDVKEMMEVYRQYAKSK